VPLMRGNVETPALLSRGGKMGLARGQVDCVMLASAGEGSPARDPGRPREFPFWLTRFPTSESYPANAGRTLRTRLGWVAAEVDAWQPHANPRGEASVAIQRHIRSTRDDFMRPSCRSAGGREGRRHNYHRLQCPQL
jgi:hypothetical protein